MRKTVAKSLIVRLSAWITATPRIHISVKYHICDFYKKFVDTLRFWVKSGGW